MNKSKYIVKKVTQCVFSALILFLTWFLWGKGYDFLFVGYALVYLYNIEINTRIG